MQRGPVLQNAGPFSLSIEGVPPRMAGAIRKTPIPPTLYVSVLPAPPLVVERRFQGAGKTKSAMAKPRYPII